MEIRYHSKFPASRGLIFVATLAACGGLLLPIHAMAGVAGAAPTFSVDVAPILVQHCAVCHEGGSGAESAVALLSYEAAASRAAAIREQVIKRAMPPWPADPEHSVKFRNDARLRDQDIATLVAWIDSGMAKGPEVAMPAAVAQGWLHPQGLAPDAVVSLPAFSVRATGEVPYIQRLIKVPYAEDKWIIAMQVRAGNHELLHHMGITEVTLPEGIKPADLNAFSSVASQLGVPNGALDAARPAVVDPANPDAYDMLGVYTPGTTFEGYPDGSARLLKGGRNAYINFNIHYTTTGKPETDRSQLALWFSPTPPKHQLFREPAAVKTLIANGQELLNDAPGTKAEGTEAVIPPIPAYMENYELTGITAYTDPVIIYQLQPHAHMRAKDFRYTVVFPDGREQTLLSVPQYDFHWQLGYELETPLTLPAGSKLIVTAHYDNSARNEHLRNLGNSDTARNCGPEKLAYFRRQNQSWDEMFSPLVQYALDHRKPPKSPQVAGHSPKTVQVVGCLASGRSATWMLTHGNEPVQSASQSSSSTEIAAAASTPLGTRRYQLIGTEAFHPGSGVGKKIAAKGVLIEDGQGMRLNVTSLQIAAAPCP